MHPERGRHSRSRGCGAKCQLAAPLEDFHDRSLGPPLAPRALPLARGRLHAGLCQFDRTGRVFGAGHLAYGLYGGLVDLSPSQSAIAAEASAFCPDGYDKTVETGWNFEDGKYEDWHIRCRKRAPSN
jgi:hypothetical protein